VALNKNFQKIKVEFYRTAKGKVHSLSEIQQKEQCPNVQKNNFTQKQ